MDDAILQAVGLTIRLATVTTLILLVCGAPLAWWLARGRGRWLRETVGALVSMPLVLPPTVLGYYLLIGLGRDGPVGQAAQHLGLAPPAFTFEGLVIGSVIYSLPFTVQPVRTAIAAIGEGPLEAAATLRAPPWDIFLRVVLPMARSGLLTGAIMSFAHTVGEFGVVLMIGGNIPGETRVVSTALYDLVEAGDYADAQALAGGMIVFAFLVILAASLISPSDKD